MFLDLIRKVDAFLRNSPAREPGKLVPVDLDDLFDDRNDPWYTEVYWVVYRFFKWNKIFHPSQIYSEIKWFIQRGRRGWADCDTWSLDNYLDGWMPSALRYLKEHKHGIPAGVFDNADGVDDTGNPNETAFQRAEARWDATMDKMIAGFEANARISDGLYEKELGPYPLRRPEGVSKEEWSKVKDDRFAASRLLEKRDYEIFKEGMALFVEHYRSLWD